MHVIRLKFFQNYTVWQILPSFFYYSLFHENALNCKSMLLGLSCLLKWLIFVSSYGLKNHLTTLKKIHQLNCIINRVMVTLFFLFIITEVIRKNRKGRIDKLTNKKTLRCDKEEMKSYRVFLPLGPPLKYSKWKIKSPIFFLLFIYILEKGK